MIGGVGDGSEGNAAAAVIGAGVVIGGDHGEAADRTAGINGEERVERAHGSIESDGAGGGCSPVVPDRDATGVTSMVGFAGLFGGISIVAFDGATAAGNDSGGGEVVIGGGHAGAEGGNGAHGGAEAVTDDSLVIADVGALQVDDGERGIGSAGGAEIVVESKPITIPPVKHGRAAAGGNGETGAAAGGINLVLGLADDDRSGGAFAFATAAAGVNGADFI